MLLGALVGNALWLCGCWCCPAQAGFKLRGMTGAAAVVELEDNFIGNGGGGMEANITDEAGGFVSGLKL